ncbi:MAG TPA: transposase [Aliiroseovarius sp.]|nr:transposase [Aliiroseovarius sp.]
MHRREWQVLNGSFWRLRTGSLWRDLPERYGPCTTVCNRFNLWAKAGVGSISSMSYRRNRRNPWPSSTVPSSARTNMPQGVKRGRGSRHRSLSWRIEHQDQRGCG